MLLDLKVACRELLKNRWFTCIVVFTLAITIGANTAIFGVVNKLMLNPLPYAGADRLVYLTVGNPRLQFASPPSSVAAAWREAARSLDSIEGYQSRDVLAYDQSGARVLRGMEITPGLPGLLGVAPLLGRGFAAADVEPAAVPVVILSYEVWQRDYGGAQRVLGRAVSLDEISHVVVGVMPPRWDAFVPGVRPEIWLPQSFAPVSSNEFQGLALLARLRVEVSFDTATRELDAILVGVLAARPRPLFGDEIVTTRVERPSQRLGASTRDALLVLLAAVGLVLLVACSNVANLLLARGASRARELSLRSVLGASTWRLVRALFAECVVLALLAGIAGLGVGWLTLRVLVRLRPDSLAMLDEVQLDFTVLTFTFGVAAATAFLFGTAPALQLTSRKLGAALRHGASGVMRGGTAAVRLRKTLIAAQMALSVVLLVSAGLLVRSVIHLQQVDIGFDAENLFTAELSLPRGRYQEGAARGLLAERLLERARALPGIAAVTQAMVGPQRYGMVVGSFEIRGTTVNEADTRAPRGVNNVQPDYFRTLGIPLLEGRTFTDEETRNGAAVIVNRAAAQHFWPGGGAVGAQIKSGGARDWATVVGVVDNVVVGGLTQNRNAPMFYSPLTVNRTLSGATLPGLLLIVRASGDPAIAIASLRSAVRDLDPEIAIPNVLLTETALASSIDAPRFNMALLIAFAVVGLVLAAVGLAAVIGYEITERTHEIGIRMALGARTETVRRLAMRQGLTPALVGMLCGLLGAFGATQLTSSLLYGVTPRDPPTFIGVVALLAVVAIGASWVPARRATQVDPIAALRAD